MKKVFAFVIALGLINLTSYSQEVAGAGSDSTAKTETVAQADSAKTTDVVAEESASEEEFVPEEKGFHQILKEKVIEGGAGFMALVIICLILGVAISIERILYLNLGMDCK